MNWEREDIGEGWGKGRVEKKGTSPKSRDPESLVLKAPSEGTRNPAYARARLQACRGDDTSCYNATICLCVQTFE